MSESERSYYDSIGQAAAAMETTVRALRWAKRKGAPGFRGSRVYPEELGPWLKAQEEERAGAGGELFEAKEPWEIRRLRLQCEALELEMRQKRGELVDVSLVRSSWLFHLRAARQVLLQLRTDLSPRIAGRPALECEALLGAAVEEALGKLRSNPYGQEHGARTACAKCGAALELFEEISDRTKGNEETERKAARDVAAHLGADDVVAEGAKPLGSAPPGARQSAGARSRKAKARSAARKVKRRR